MGQIVIVGNSAAGLSALETFRKYDKKDDVLIISKEGVKPYSRVLIPYVLKNKLPYAGITIRDEDYYKNLNSTCVQDEIIKLEPEAHRLIGKKNTYSYDKVLLATGSHAAMPRIKGGDQDGVFNMWTKNDLDHLIPYFDKSKRVCIIGSGFVALQAAWAARVRGLDVTVIEIMKRIMPTVLDEKAAAILTQKIKDCGVTLMTETSTQEFEKLPDGSFLVHLDGKESVKADFIIVGTGVRSNVAMLDGTAAVINRGLWVDEHMSTGLPDVYAAGDVAAGPTIFGDAHMNHALWPTAIEEGEVAGKNLAGQDCIYKGSLNMNVTEMFNVTVASMGKFKDEDVDSSYVYDESDGLGYLKICYKDGKLIGGCLVGSYDAVDTFGRMRQIIRKHETLDCRPEEVRECLTLAAFKEAASGEFV